MPCDTRLRKRQTLAERKTEVKDTVKALDAALKKRKVGVKVGPQGAVTFTGWRDEERNGVTDACAYRQIMATGSSLAKAEIARAEQIAGRSVNRQVVAQGVHSHDGGTSWHGKG